MSREIIETPNDKFPQEQRHGTQSINRHGIPVLPNDDRKKRKRRPWAERFKRDLAKLDEIIAAKAGKNVF